MQIWRGRGRAGGRDCCLWDVSGYRRVFGAAAGGLSFSLSQGSSLPVYREEGGW